MKTDADKWKFRLFIGSLVVLAFILNARFDFGERQPSPTVYSPAEPTTTGQPTAVKPTAEKPAAVRPAEPDPAAERAKFMARYFQTNVQRRSGTKTVAIAVATENAQASPAVSAALIHHLQTDTVVMLPSFCRPEFVTDGLLDEVLANGGEMFKNMNLTAMLDGALLARQQVRYGTNAALENVITANLQLEVAFFPFADNALNQRWTLLANGAGFNPGAARLQAEERLLQQIAQDTNLSLTPFLSLTTQP